MRKFLGGWSLEKKRKTMLLRCSNEKDFLKAVTGVLGGAYKTDNPLKQCLHQVKSLSSQLGLINREAR